MEVAVLQADIEVWADRVIDLGEQLPRKLALALAELVDSGIADAGAEAAANPGLTAEIDPAIEHGVPDVGRLVEIEVAIGEERASRSESRTVTPTAAVSGNAAGAVQYALAQVGKAYVYGAAGPSAYDCSGLTMAAWGSAGVSLPHSSSAQMGYGTPVSISALQPGDLVFYYSPVSHVAMYIGNGMIVHAANPSQGVRTDPVGLMPISGAVRPG